MPWFWTHGFGELDKNRVSKFKNYVTNLRTIKLLYKRKKCYLKTDIFLCYMLKTAKAKHIDIKHPNPLTEWL